MTTQAWAATSTVRPNGDVTTQWGVGGGNDTTCSGAHCSRVDEPVPNTSDYIETPIILGGNLTDAFDMGTVGVGQRATQITVRTYLRSAAALPVLDAMDTLTPSLWIAGGYMVGSEITPNYPTWAWFDTVFAGNWSQADVDGMRIRYVNNIKGLGLVQNNLQIATSEAVVTYTPDALATQSVYRTYQNTNSTTPGSPIGPQSTAVDIPGGSSFRMRVGLDISTNQLLSNSYQYKLQYAQRSGACDTGFSGEVYSDVASSGPVHWYDNPGITTGTAITANTGNDPSSGDPLVFQTYQEASPFTNPQQINAGSTGIWDLVLATDLQTVGSYCFRVVKNDGQSIAYSVIPEVAFTGSLDIDLVDAGGQPSTQPVQFSPIASGVACQTSTAVLGTASQQVRITNNSSSSSWTASFAPAAGPSAAWSEGVGKYDINDHLGCSDGGDSDDFGGRLSVNPSTSVLTPYGGCSTAGITKGSMAHFSEGAVDAITIANASSSAERFCSWSIKAIGLTQAIPGGQMTGVYASSMVLTLLNS